MIARKTALMGARSGRRSGRAPRRFGRLARALFCLGLGVFAAQPAAVARADAAALDAIRARVLADDAEAALLLLAALPPADAAAPELRYLTARLHERRGQIARALAEGAVEKHLHGPVAHAGFRRLTG